MTVSFRLISHSLVVCKFRKPWRHCFIFQDIVWKSPLKNLELYFICDDYGVDVKAAYIVSVTIWKLGSQWTDIRFTNGVLVFLTATYVMCSSAAEAETKHFSFSGGFKKYASVIYLNVFFTWTLYMILFKFTRGFIFSELFTTLGDTPHCYAILFTASDISISGLTFTKVLHIFKVKTVSHI